VKRLLGLLLALLAMPLAAQDEGEEAWAEEFHPLDFTCPVGGESFRQDVGYDAFPFETLPDGSWLGDIAIDAQIPVCPGNGLLILPDYAAMGEQEMVYHDYTDAELAQLPALIADPAYSAAKSDGRHVQAYWLATKLDRPALDRFMLLQRATWAALAPELRHRLVAKFVAEAPALIEASDMPEQWKRFQTGYVINGLRELGRFDEALALLDRLEAEGPLSAPVDPDDIFVEELGSPMRLAIGQRDDGRFPIELLGRRLVGLICDGAGFPPYDQRTPANLAACDARRERENREAAAQEDAFDESFALRDDVPALERLCSEIAEEARSQGQQMACESLQQAHDERAAAELVKDGAAAAASCTATPEDEQKGPLFHACIAFNSMLESALGEAIARDEAAWTIICPGGEHDAEVPDRNSHVSMGCIHANDERGEMAEAALLADPVALDAKCASTSEDEFFMPLYGACSTRAQQLEDAAIELRASDPAEFDRHCARYRSTNDAGNEVYELTEEQDMCRRAWRLRENRKAKAEAEARGLVCFSDVIYSPDRPRCVTPAEYDAEFAIGRRGDIFDQIRDDRYDENSSLRQAARAQAAAIVAEAKAAGTYPKRRPGDRF
jgi:hypothetical protein